VLRPVLGELVSQAKVSNRFSIILHRYMSAYPHYPAYYYPAEYYYYGYSYYPPNYSTYAEHGYVESQDKPAEDESRNQETSSDSQSTVCHPTTEREWYTITKHKKKRIYTCTACDKEFTRTFNLKDHYKATHLHLKPYECPVEGCRSRFARKNDFWRHQRLIHKKKLEENVF
jgi:uncharacterized Zn-finger protein